MASTLLSRRISVAIGGAAIFAMIGFTAACSSDSEEPAPETSTTETTLSPTEKSLNPGGGVFTPPVTAPQPTFDPQQND